MNLSENAIEMIIKHEDDMLKEYQKIVCSYQNEFLELGCELKVTRYWFNFFECISSDERLPLKNGYQCILACEVLKNNEAVFIPEDKNDSDSYMLLSTWIVSQVTRRFFSKKINIYYDYQVAENDINRMLLDLRQE